MGEIEDLRSSKRFLLLKEQWRLVLELCHYSEDVNPLWQNGILQDTLKTLSRPAIALTESYSEDEIKFRILTHYFFKQRGYSLAKPTVLKLQDYFLPSVLNARTGPAPLLMLLLCTLFEECGIKAQVISCHKRYLLKVQLNSRAHVVDFEDSCRFLEPFEIVDLINRGFDFSNGALGMTALVVEYLEMIKARARVENNCQVLTLTHGYLMRYQPFNLKHLRERALLAYETGDYRTAIDDIRSYFQYKQPGLSNSHLKRIYKLALRRHRLHP